MYRKKYLCLVFSAVSLITLSTAKAESSEAAFKSLSDELKTCSSKGNNSKRLKCYDELASRNASDIATPTNQQGALPNDLGGSKFNRDKKNREQGVGRVKSCQKSHDGRWFYIFEDGQVWKQVDRVKRRYKECKFEATISKDGLGYKMSIVGKSSTVRIRRHR